MQALPGGADIESVMSELTFDAAFDGFSKHRDMETEGSGGGGRVRHGQGEIPVTVAYVS